MPISAVLLFLLVTLLVFFTRRGLPFPITPVLFNSQRIPSPSTTPDAMLATTLPLLLSFLLSTATSGANPSDAAAMRSLAESLSGDESLGWDSAADPCTWSRVSCTAGRVTAIQVGNRSLSGSLPLALGNLTSLSRLEFQNNRISGPLPSLRGLSRLEVLLLHNNLFTSMPPDFFSGLSALQVFSLDYNPFDPWHLPDSLRDASTLVNFSANSVKLTGGVPQLFAGSTFPGLNHLALANNLLEGPLPAGFAGSSITSLWLNQGGNSPGLSGSIDVIQNMTNLVQLWLHSNNFSGPLPDFSALVNLEECLFRDNGFTGPVPQSLVSLPSLKHVSLTNNLLQGPIPVFPKNVQADMDPKSERFCLPNPGECDSRVSVLLSVAKSFGYPRRFADNWKGNDPCSGWLGVSCDSGGNVTVVNFKNMGLGGTISPDFSMLPALQKLILSGNGITGTIPESLTSLLSLKELDVSNNLLHGVIPKFRADVVVITSGNPDIGKDIGDKPPEGGPSSSGDSGGGRSSPGSIVGGVLGAVVALLLIGGLGLHLYKKKSRRRCQNTNTVVVHPRHSGSGPNFVKIAVADSNSGAASTTVTPDHSGPSDVHIIEAGNMVISIQVLREVTNNFCKENILGQGGFGTVYKGELHDGTKIAVKRMESGVMGSKGSNEFQSEIDVLTKVRHRHLVSLLGYCLDGNERLLVYEYMPQGTLSRHLFHWKVENLEPLEWNRRLSIALDVARGVEYLHSLANQIFIHRDLKPSNILLGDDMKAKVADFGLVRLAPDGISSIETRLAGTFGYLAPEYAVTGRVTTKVDVFSFGVILMELITGRKALDDSQPEESIHLVTWFRRMLLNKDSFPKAIDPIIDLEEESLVSISTVAELAGHCCAREPYQRPVMSHVVNVLSSLAETWKPTEPDSEDGYGIDLDMTLSQALLKWQALDGNTDVGANSITSLGSTHKFLGSTDNTQSSIPTASTDFSSIDAR